MQSSSRARGTGRTLRSELGAAPAASPRPARLLPGRGGSARTIRRCPSVPGKGRRAARGHADLLRPLPRTRDRTSPQHPLRPRHPEGLPRSPRPILPPTPSASHCQTGVSTARDSPAGASGAALTGDRAGTERAMNDETRGRHLPGPRPPLLGKALTAPGAPAHALPRMRTALPAAPPPHPPLPFFIFFYFFSLIFFPNSFSLKGCRVCYWTRSKVVEIG